jgi:uncharacterized protein (DUF1684 family)
MFRTSLILALIVGASTVHADVTPRYAKQIQQWRAQRVKALTAPYGWLSLVGLPWLQHGVNTVGSAADNDVVIASAPAHLGRVDWKTDGSVEVHLAAGTKARIEGTHRRSATLLDDSHAHPTTVRFGTTEFYLKAQNGRKALRVKDSTAKTRTHFSGLDYFPINPSLRIVAHWIAFKPQHQIKMANEIGGIDTYPVPGKAVFQYQGHTYSVEPVIEAPGEKQYFLVFSDATSGKQTYGAARFLYIDPPRKGSDTVVIDFNKAYNPPCAFTPYATCNLAPPENRLPFRVTAGELTYKGPSD